MKPFNNTIGTKSMRRNLTLALAATLASASLALATNKGHRRPDAVKSTTSGQVEVVHQIPGGVVTVGVEVGRPRPVVVEEHQKIVVVERQRPRHQHGHVTVIHDKPRHEVKVIKTIHHGHGKKNITVVRKIASRDSDWDRHDDNCRAETRPHKNHRHGNNHFHK